MLDRPLKLFDFPPISNGLPFELKTTLHAQNPRSYGSYLFLVLQQGHSNSFLIEICQQLVTLRIIYQGYGKLRVTQRCPSIAHPLDRCIMTGRPRSIPYSIDPRLQLVKTHGLYFPRECHGSSFRFFNHEFIIFDYEGRTISPRGSRVILDARRKIYSEMSNHRDNPEPMLFK